MTVIDIIIPNLNGLENLKQVLNSINSQTFRDYNIILVDNGSSDGSIEYLEQNQKSVVIIKNETNLGFAKAINLGINYSLNVSKSEFILLLNNDIELTKNFLELAVRTFSENSEADFLAVKMLNYYNRNVIDDTGDFIRYNGGTPMARGHGEEDSKKYDKGEFVFSACAGAAFYKSELFKNAGLFDEDFFAYLEDVDLSFRFQLQGFKCYYNPEIICYHKRRETTRKFEGWETYFTEKNIVAIRMKNYPFPLYLKYFPLFFLSRIKRYYKFFVNYPKGTFKAAIKGYIKGISELPKSIKKRRAIQRSKTVSTKYIENLFIK